jgi:hypothetical protein
MIRRIFRIFAVVTVVLAVSGAVVSHFRENEIGLNHAVFITSPDGFEFDWDSTSSIGTTSWFVPLDIDPVHKTEWLPSVGTIASGRIVFIFLPWWLLVFSSALFTAIVFRLTRRRKASPAFPVETDRSSA